MGLNLESTPCLRVLCYCLWFLLQQQPQLPMFIKLNMSIRFLREFIFPFDVRTKTVTDPLGLYKDSGRDSVSILQWVGQEIVCNTEALLL